MDSLEHILLELRAEQAALLDFGDALDAKLNLAFGGQGLVLGAFLALRTITGAPVWYWMILSLLVLLYVYATLSTLRMLFPQNYHFPLCADYDHLREEYARLTLETGLLETMISQNVEAIAKNKTLLARKSSAVKVGLVGVTVTLLLLTVLQMVG